MTDPFSVSAGVVGVVSLGLTLGQGLVRYYGPWRDYDDEIRGFTIKVDGLLSTLCLLNGFLSPQTNLQLPSDQYRLLVLDNLASCKEACGRLEKMLEECQSSKPNVPSSSSLRKHDWLRLKKMAYPFKKDTLVALSGLVSGLQDDLSLSLQLLQCALMSQQQRQIQDLISRTSLIDITTTKILTLVGQQVVPAKSHALVQQTPQTTQFTSRTMPEPSLLRDLCDQQQLMNAWLRRKRRVPASQIEQISQYCTCRRRPQFVSSSGGYYNRRPLSGSSLSAYSLHEEPCPLYVEGQQQLGVAGSWTLCNRFLGLSLQVMMTSTRGAGSFAFSPVIRLKTVVASNSPAFDFVKMGFRSYPGTDPDGEAEWVKMTLLKMFQERRAAPTDRLEDGSTILHAVCSSFPWYGFGEASNPWGGAKALMKALIDIGAHSNECTVTGTTAADMLIRRFPSSGRLHQFDEWVSCLEILLNSGGYINSILVLRNSRRWDYMASKGARFLLTKSLHGFELLEIEIAILSRSAESLSCCLVPRDGQDPNDSLMTPRGYSHVLSLSLGWPEGLKILLESSLRQPIDHMEDWPIHPIGNCFVKACDERETECAEILLEYLEFIDLNYLRAAAQLEHIPIICGIISALVKSRRKLQELALEHLPHNVLCSLSLPSSTLLDSRAFDVYEVLNNHNIEVQPPSYERASVYGSAQNDIAIFERLYAAGFTDLNQCDGNSIKSLMGLYSGLDSRDPFKLIKSADWLVFRGANLYQQSEEGYPSFFSLVHAFGYSLHIYAYHGKKYGEDLRLPLLEQHPDVLEFLCPLITDDSRDNCSCACSTDSCCSSYQQMLHGFFRFPAYPNPSTTAFATMIDALQSAAFGRVSENQRRNIALQTLRYLMFDALDITHTCHKAKEYYRFWGYEVGQLDDDEIQEIHEEEAELISQLDELVADFARKYDEFGIGLHEFIKQYVKPRLDEICDSEEEEEEEVDPDYQQRVRDLGVNLE